MIIEEINVILVLRVFVGLKRIIKEKFSNLFVTVFFLREEWLSIFTLLNRGLSRSFCSEMLLQILSNNNIMLGKVVEHSLLLSMASGFIEHFSLTFLCYYFIFKFLAFRF